ncbi:class I SAM-dependent methyltransferase [Otariodibacter oris]|uniref:Methyltransferase family protein n=1 Tax=Otariodibacter oris TaxID=1032623 RepID=A0A420XJ07_9PAST|nr:class I SAM-dependent methyltransferase [Otariodibacter oris]QGM80698.1 methyltransferase [Otariodibacter oris]RKR77141.1 methyltransferase family protein [Otariodibacter oris]
MNTLADKWNNNYRNEQFVYGKTPNTFFKNELDKLSPASILLGAEGEGRNAVYAAKNNWTVSAFDISEEGRKKALKLAEENQTSINYVVGELPNLAFEPESFDAIGLVFAHFPPSLRSDYHKKLASLLKKGGYIIFEAFSKQHLAYRTENPKVGGPDKLELLFSIEELKDDFKDFDFWVLEEKEVELSEGLLHNGKGKVIRFVAQKQ